MIALLTTLALGYTDRGILKLDNTTFDRLIDGSKTVFVRFDKEYSYGDEHDAWKSFAAKVGDSSADILICDVGVSEYGDKDNADISDRYSIKSDDFPQYRLCARLARHTHSDATRARAWRGACHTRTSTPPFASATHHPLLHFL